MSQHLPEFVAQAFATAILAVGQQNGALDIVRRPATADG